MKNRIQSVYIIPAIGLATGVIFGGCWSYAELHCANLDGDSTCGSGLYCSVCDSTDHGCVSEKPSDECYRPGAGLGGSGGEGTMSTAGGQGGGTSDITMGGGGDIWDSSTTLEPTPCANNGDCTDDTEPFCEPQSGMCVSCEDMPDPNAACTDMSGGVLPTCAVGVCVECTLIAHDACISDSLACDESSNTCVPCTYHAQCMQTYGSEPESGPGCHIEEGKCLSAESVWHVDRDADGDVADGTFANPYQTIGAAIDQIKPDQKGTIVLYEIDNGDAYTERVVIDGGRVIAIVAHGTERPQIGPFTANVGGGEYPVWIDGDNTYGYLEGLALRQIDRRGLYITEAAVAYLDRCSVIIDQDQVAVHALSGSSIHVRSSVLWVDNSSSNVHRSAIRLNAGMADITYSTVVNVSNNDNSFDLSCGAEKASLATVRNSILISTSTDSDCQQAIVQSSAGSSIPLRKENFDLNIIAQIDAMFRELNGGPGQEADLHLTAIGAMILEDIALRTEADPPFDIDGDLRPEVGHADYVGADIYMP